MPGGGDAVGGGVREKYDGSGTFVPVEAVGLDSLQVVKVGDGDWVADKTHADTAWDGNGDDKALGRHGPRLITSYIQDGLSDRRGTAELSC